MIQGRIVGTLWATRGLKEICSQRLVLVAAVSAGRIGPQVLVAADPMDAKVGDEVLVSLGSGARTAVSDIPADPKRPIDAAVTAILSED